MGLRVSQPDDTTLEFVHTPWGTWVFALFFILLGPVMVLFLQIGTVTKVECERSLAGAVSCVASYNLLGRTYRETRYEDVRGAEVQRSSGSRGGTTYQLLLVTPAGPQPVNPGFASSARGAEPLAVEINRLISGDSEPRVAGSYGNPFELAFLGIFSAAGLFMLLKTTIATWRFDRRQGEAILTQSGLLGVKSERVALGEIMRAETTANRSSKGRRTYNLRLHLRRARSHDFLGLAASSDRRGLEQMAERINALVVGAAPQPSALGLTPLPAGAPAAPPVVAPATGATIALGGRPEAGARFPDAATGMGAAIPGLPDAATGMGAAIPGLPPPPTGYPTAQGSSGLGGLLLGALTLQGPAYRRIAESPGETSTAFAIVLTSAAVSAFISNLFSQPNMTVNGTPIEGGLPFAIAMTLVSVLAAVMAWQMVSRIAAGLAASPVMQGRTDRGEMLRVLGFAHIFGFLGALGFGGWLLGVLLSAAATVIAIREAAEFESHLAMVTAGVAWAFNALFNGIVWLVGGGLVLSALAAITAG